LIVDDQQSRTDLLHIVFIRNSSIGDVVLSTACLDYLERAVGTYRVTWIGRSPSLQLLSDSFPRVECRDFAQFNAAEFFDQRRSEKLVIVDLQANAKTRSLCFKARLQYGVPSYRPDKFTFARTLMVMAAQLRGRRSPLPPHLLEAGKHQFQRMVSCVEKALHANGALEDPSCSQRARPRLVPKPAERLILAESDIILAVGVGAAHFTKRAPLNILSSILQQTHHLIVAGAASARAKILFLGGSEDETMAENVGKAANWSAGYLNMCGKLTLMESASYLQQSDALLCNDSALAHMSEAVGISCAVLFGPTIEAFGFAPWREQSQAWSSPLGCRPCSKHGSRLCRYGDMRCFYSLATKELATRLAALLLEKYHLKKGH
jgi:ADP-heptose:LPS heptosyltransferase